MTQTVIPYGSPLAIRLQSAGLFAANMQRNSTLNRLAGKFSQQSDAEGVLRQQTSNDMPIVRNMDLTKTAGEEISFDLINPMGGKPIMGERMAEGRGRTMSFSQDKLRINQTRYPISAGGQMTQQRTPHQLRRLARAQGESYMNRLQDQLTLVHMAGSRGFHNNIEWAIPLASDLEFAEICVNAVKAPTKNRHFLSTGSGIEPVSATAGEINIATTDVLNATVVDGLRTYLDSMPLPPPPVIFDGDKMAADAPIRVLLVSSEQYTSFVQSTNFRTLQANAMARSSAAGQNPLFMGEAGLWNGILIVKMPKPIRFYAGSSLRYCASYTSEAETSSDVVPASFGTAYAVDRAILLGGQALAEAYGKNGHTGNPFFWSEKLLDHDDKLEVLIGMMAGKSKIRFEIDYGETKQFTDQGIMVIDTAVAISGQ
ncbi:N4-gp56 family major capsid protein [Variovorax boronicumulans]|uniref:N4-gp56 family major capsid protein n=1 Tax=Variovorax boronicumulans TaxID=436515 RepID=UPI0012E672DD|nr:N4-gp56 family major capsid protein [Variovorax boronicumulans]GER16685.1 N4-gp56 family major capsid protein [Variovorax boronicumulans]